MPAVTLTPAPVAAVVRPAQETLLPGWTRIDRGPAGGTVWQGVIPGDPAGRRISAVYLPPHAGRATPLLVLLHGFPGSPWSLALGLRFAEAADVAIASGRVAPFVAVMPGAALRAGEWAGRWERWLVHGVLPWAARMLPVGTGDRVLAGLSAGGYGAVDIGLRHPRLFATLESWSGYFRPFADGPLRGASAAAVRAHDPTRLLRLRAPLVRRLNVRVYLSAGTRDRGVLADAIGFDRLLARLHVRHELVLAPGGHDGRFWRAQLPAALAYAFSRWRAPGSALPLLSSRSRCHARRRHIGQRVCSGSARNAPYPQTPQM